MSSRQYYDYTNGIMDLYYDMAGNNTKMIWNELGNKYNCVVSGNWKEHFQTILKRYKLSSRFALMRILYSKTTNTKLLNVTEDMLKDGFDVVGFGHFSDISVEHANKLSEEEVSLYKNLLMQRVKDFDSTNVKEADTLIDNALSIAENGNKISLNREEILRLGHMLNFSLEEMDFFLLRVLGDNEKGLSFSSSEDLADMYGYCKHMKLSEVDGLKNWYHGEEKKIKKKSFEEKPSDWTQETGNSFMNMVASWKDSSNHLEEMKKWLVDRAPFLDMKSKTVLRVYRNFAMYAYCLTRPEKYLGTVISKKMNLYSEVERFSSMTSEHECAKTLFYENGKISEKKCKNIAESIMLANRDLARGEQAQVCTEASENFYHVIHVDNGKINVRGKLNEGYGESTKRLKDILVGAIDPNKGDLLFLLWFVVNYQWVGYTDDAKEKAGRLLEFIDAAQCMLNHAMLPDFYPINILEDAMMSSIVLEDSKNSPSKVYEEICTVFTNKGVTKKKEGTITHTDDEKIAIVEYYLLKNKEGKYTVKECAVEFQVSSASVNNWVKEYKAGELYTNSKKIEVVKSYFSKKGCTIEKHAEDSNVEKSALEKWIKYYQSGKIYSDDEKAKIIAELLELEADNDKGKVDFKACEERYNIKQSVLKNWLKDHKEKNSEN